MPRLSVFLVRASLVYLVLGFTFGGLLLANKGLMFLPAVWALLPVHIEFSLLGWMVQLALGIAFWILPRFSNGPMRGDERLSWAAFLLLNVGIWLVVLQGLFGTDWSALAGRVFELLGLALFAIGNWRRVKPHGV